MTNANAASHPGGSYMNAVNQTAIGSIILLWGSLLMLQQTGIIDKGLSTWPFVFVAFGALLMAGGVYRLQVRKKSKL